MFIGCAWDDDGAHESAVLDLQGEARDEVLVWEEEDGRGQEVLGDGDTCNTTSGTATKTAERHPQAGRSFKLSASAGHG